ncbi:DUF2087 domain-containing protein [Alteribacter natronophilus]|uniref:DUF2087 domain-containing protein n=1 Tax=Alteribacter natronophilus TaxID=2583810 RepID=UPI00110DA385|nr:DUF2087 domain-containing protein [Alteribacter natronophilus]TMW71522.1 DUF2087 domain-containing protein [Alteribacter natronophilus]
MEELFWDCEPEVMRRGYVYEEGRFNCLVCGAWYEEGVIYSQNGEFTDARKAAERHIKAEHGSMERQMLALSKKQTGLSEVQQQVLGRMLEGQTDEQIAAGLGFTSLSTVRQYRFKFREKTRQARVMLALMDAYEQSEKNGDVHKGAKMVDDRWKTTKEENDKFLETYVDSSTGKITQFPRKEKRKIVILKYLTGKFDPAKTYTEREVSERLKEFYDDFATLRRYLIEYGFMKRNQDGSRYYVDPTAVE